jgi:lipopolysaccharide/colanic/teichoic acid biosynthesis glycosyltransferase
MTLAIWLHDRANPFFVQERVGKDGRLFRAWKFRTMVPNAEELLQRRFAEDEAARLEFKTHMKLRNDPRITRVGRLLRKTSLDELPQLMNVLRGEMSLVGPRPVPLYHHEEFSGQGRMLRERVLPGMTGLWQISDRAEPGPAYMEKWDSYYVRNWSIWLDIVILARTMGAVTRGDSHSTLRADDGDALRPKLSVEQQIPLQSLRESADGRALSRTPVDAPPFSLTGTDDTHLRNEVTLE